MQFDKFTIKSQEAVQEAQALASDQGHQEILPVHLLAVLLQETDGVILPVLQKVGINLPQLQQVATAQLAKQPSVSGGGFGQVNGSQQLQKIFDLAFKCYKT